MTAALPEMSGNRDNGHMDVAAALRNAETLCQPGQEDAFLAQCEAILYQVPADLEAVISVGSILASQGFLTRARDCFEVGRRLAPQDYRFTIHLANIFKEAGDHTTSRRFYEELLRLLPHQPNIRRSALSNLEYDNTVTDAYRLDKAKDWGQWAMACVGGMAPRPRLSPLEGRPLRLGYVSADLCHHPVGLFLKNVLANHDPRRVTVFTYSAGTQYDPINLTICSLSHFRDVSRMDDRELAAHIRQDDIDILIDLSGHTASSRLTAFALRPAPVQASWLGYYATTGLPVMDAVILDPWHAPPGAEAWFTEAILRLPETRFCYAPLSFAPEVAPPPCLRRGYVTFGCYNNTAKLNPEVLALWARILAHLPGSRLVLKWRTFRDPGLRNAITQTFAAAGIHPDRLELRGVSSHKDLLDQYADIDIALDPFPFSGGLTSCECLWMGLPVITLPGSRVVSRQTLAFIANLGRQDWLEQWVAKDQDAYVAKALALAADPGRIAAIRNALRPTMRASPLVDAPRFTQNLEAALRSLYESIREKQEQYTMGAQRTVVHVGAGHGLRRSAVLPKMFRAGEWKEVRLNNDPATEPDIIGSLGDLSALTEASVDAVYAIHLLHLLAAHEVETALRNVWRVLRPEGFAVLACPDLEALAKAILEGKLVDPAYVSPAGSPVTPLDLLYGFRPALAAGHKELAPRCGFTVSFLSQLLHQSGFATVGGLRNEAAFDLWMLASKSQRSEKDMRDLMASLLA